MHPSCIKNAAHFATTYLNPTASYKIIDIGGFNCNGTLRPLFTYDNHCCHTCGDTQTYPKICCSDKPMVKDTCCDGEKFIENPVKNIGKEWKYYGLDTADTCTPFGDLSQPEKHRYNIDIVTTDIYKYPFRNSEIDVIVSTSCLEHDPMFWRTFTEMVRVVKDGGFIYLNAPSSGPYHGFPLDCFRFLKDSFKSFPLFAPEAIVLEAFVDEDSPSWKDSIGIFTIKK